MHRGSDDHRAFIYGPSFLISPTILLISQKNIDQNKAVIASKKGPISVDRDFSDTLLVEVEFGDLDGGLVCSGFDARWPADGFRRISAPEPWSTSVASLALMLAFIKDRD